MIGPGPKIRTINVSAFAARCSEHLRTVEEEGITLAITRHGKVVAQVNPSSCQPEGRTAPKNLKEFMGSLKGQIFFASDSALDEPAFDTEDWEDHPANLSPLSPTGFPTSTGIPQIESS